jgi:hypothetical protein
MRLPSGPMPSDDAQDAFEKVMDPDRLLEGEDPTTTYLDDAKHWVHVYGELLEFKASVAGEAASSAADLPAVAQAESDADLTILEAERRRLERRYAFWQTRLGQLRAT